MKKRPDPETASPNARRFLFLCLLLSACARVETPRQTPPYETLLTIVAEFQQYAGRDLYRCEMPRDLTGQNLFRATLARLEAFEDANPGRDADVVRFTRGGAYARLGGFQRAAEAFDGVDSASPLAEEAARWSEKCRRLESASRATPDGGLLQDYLNDLESRRDRLAKLGKDFGDDYAALLARRERERTDVERALFLFRNRYVLEGGAAPALEAARGLARDHAESARLNAHRLLLGRFYFELARDLADLAPPDRLGFDAARCLELAAAANEQFALVSRADGFEEKLEGIALARELEAFVRGIRRLSR